MSHPAVRSIEDLYQAALSSEGAERVERFSCFGQAADVFAEKNLFGVKHSQASFGIAYANLMHNFWGSLGNIRVLADNRDYLLRNERYGAEKYDVAQAYSDKVLVENGRSTVELLERVITPDFGNSQNGLATSPDLWRAENEVRVA